MELEKAFRRIAGNGITIAEIFVNTDCELYEPYAGEMLNVQREYGVKVSSVHPYTGGIEPMMFFSPYERRVDDILDYFKRFFEYMNKFGAEIFVFHGNKFEHPCPRELYFERFLRLAETAESFGVTAAQENVSRCMSRSLDFLSGMRSALGDKVKFVLDIKQARRSGEDPLKIISVLGESIVHLHYSDGGEKGDCLKFGDGDTDNLALFTAMKNIGYKGDVIIELYNNGSYASPEDLAENCRVLDGFLKENGFG